MAIAKEFKELKELEKRVNKHLYQICSVITVVTMAMITVSFFTRGDFPPTRIGLLYLGILVIYSIHKELVRWLGERKVERQGELFVYAWIIFAVVLYVINFSAKDFFVFSPRGVSLDILRETAIIALEVLAIFLVTRGSKLIKVYLTRKNKGL